MVTTKHKIESERQARIRASREAARNRVAAPPISGLPYFTETPKLASLPYFPAGMAGVAPAAIRKRGKR